VSDGRRAVKEGLRHHDIGIHPERRSRPAARRTPAMPGSWRKNPTPRRARTPAASASPTTPDRPDARVRRAP
jgi:hypothetical protein